MVRRIFKIFYNLLPVLYTVLLTAPLFFAILFDNGNINISERLRIILPFVFVAFITYLVSHRNEVITKKQNILSSHIHDGELSIATYRYDLIRNSFVNVIKNNGVHNKLNYDPKEKLLIMLKALSSSIESFIDIESKYVSVSLFYNFNYEAAEKWHRIDKNYVLAYEDNKSVIFEKDSFGYFVMHEGTDNFYLLNNKFRDGEKLKRYKPNKKDNETKQKFRQYGSIFGLKIIESDNDGVYIKALLTVSTYGKKIDRSFGVFRDKIKKQLEYEVLPTIKANISAELIQIYIKDMPHSEHTG